ncbi:hypothetical protein HDV00_007260 [Rhizophlyctis rosea]|nr:hypothetical protein HDV00_007260 [Rhizophlyctis rosea]
MLLRSTPLILGAISGAFAAFGLTTSSASYTIDTGADLTWVVRRSDGMITSIKYKGVEYQSTAKLSGINSGLGSSSVSATTVDGQYIKVAIKSNGLPVTHYYVARKGDNIIYMATQNTGEVDPGELRMLFRLNKGPIPTGYTYNGMEPSEISGGTVIEGSDVYTKDGMTRSKFYSSERFIDDQVHGVTGNGVGLWMVIPGTAYESSAGGPFMRDINNQEGDQQEIYWYMNSGHLRTEPWRYGLHGPYALVFNGGSKASPNLDTSFFDQLSIAEYVPASGRGQVSGTATGVPSKFETVVYWYNTKAQYWTKASGGTYKSPLMKPGTYTVKMLRGEFVVYTGSVTVSAGSTTTHNIASSEPSRNVIWQVGEFDGQPFELKNGLTFLRMHPSDKRMSSWGGSYTVGQSSPKDFPMALFEKTGGTATIRFNVQSISSSGAATIRVGTTLSFQGGRPAITVNSYKCPTPATPVKIDSRGVTRGGYRGYGEVYTCSIPAGTIKTGSNTVTLGVAGSNSMADYLSSNYIVDAVALEGTGIVVDGGSTSGEGTTQPPAQTTTSRITTTTRAPTTTTTTARPSGGQTLYGQCGGNGCQHAPTNMADDVSRTEEEMIIDLVRGNREKLEARDAELKALKTVLADAQEKMLEQDHRLEALAKEVACFKMEDDVLSVSIVSSNEVLPPSSPKPSSAPNAENAAYVKADIPDLDGFLLYEAESILDSKILAADRWDDLVAGIEMVESSDWAAGGFVVFVAWTNGERSLHRGDREKLKARDTELREAKAALDQAQHALAAREQQIANLREQLTPPGYSILIDSDNGDIDDYVDGADEDMDGSIDLLWEPEGNLDQDILDADSWEELVAEIDTVEGPTDATEPLVVFLTWRDGMRTMHTADTLHEKCPLKVRRFA